MAELYRPKGPLLLFMQDLEKDTVGWSEVERWRYLKLLDHLWSQGGFVPDDDKYLADAIGMQKTRGWKQNLAKIRTKLMVASDEEMAKITVRYGGDRAYLSTFFTVSQLGVTGFLSQKRILRDLAKVTQISHKRAKAGAKGGSNSQANAPPGDKQLLSSLTPTPTPIANDLPTDPSSATAVGRLSDEKGNETDERHVAIAFQNGLNEYYPGTIRSLLNLDVEAKGWLAQGATVKTMLECIEKGMAWYAREGRSAPNGLAAFRNSIKDETAKAGPRGPDGDGNPFERGTVAHQMWADERRGKQAEEG